MTRVLGVDLSLTGTGLASFDLAGGIGTHLVKTVGKKDDTWLQRSSRLGVIEYRVLQEADIVEPDLVVIEAPSYGSVHGAQHDRSGLWWLVVHTLIEEGYDVAMVSPNGRAKYATGKGNSPKDAVLAAAIRTYPQADITDNNVADAVVIGAMGMRWLGEPIEDSLPAKNLEAMDGAAWPS